MNPIRSFGYLGSVALLLFKDLRQISIDGPLASLQQSEAAAVRSGEWLDFFISFSYITTGVCVVAFFLSTLYFREQSREPDVSDDGGAVVSS